jgi:6-phosphogluconolactonase
MEVHVEPTADATDDWVVGRLGEALEAAVSARGHATLALSRPSDGLVGKLASAALPWADIHLFEVDERVVGDADPERNWTLLAPLASLLGPDRAHPMPVGEAAGAQTYGVLLRQIAGNPVVLDAVHMGLGPDGHTASLPPGVAVPEDVDVAEVKAFRGYDRLTLTRPALQRARLLLWQVNGADKAGIVSRFVAGDREVVASTVATATSELVLDSAAASLL